MKKYIEQFYSEGLATTFYLKPANYLKKKIKNKQLRQLMLVLIRGLYTLLALIIVGVFIYIKLIKK